MSHYRKSGGHLICSQMQEDVLSGIKKKMYQKYSDILRYYRSLDKDTPSLIRFLIENAVILSVILGKHVRHWNFPERATGGWWWIWRYRFEVITSWYEYGSVIWCRRLLRPGMHALDIGAHIGYYSRLFSRLVGPNGMVLSYEPCPENYPILMNNLEHAPYKNFQLFDIAVSDQSGYSNLFVSPGHSNHSLKSGYTDSHEKLEVKTSSIDSHLQALSIENIDFVKMDTEGAEIEVLQGMRKTISRSPHLNMIVEINPKALQSGGHTQGDLCELLASLGFVIREIAENGDLNAPDPHETDKTRNLLCVRPDKWKELGIRT